MSNKHGVLLLNIGTPDDLSGASVRKYLREFLSDPRVIDIPFLLRFFLVNGLIVPFRYRKTLAAYSKVWGPSGSPLLLHSIVFKDRLNEALGEEYQVEIGMRYGKPSIDTAIANLENCTTLTIIPMFPQYASASTGSAMQETLRIIAEKNNVPALRSVRDFYDDVNFINAFVDRIQTSVDLSQIDLLLLSYHGLPERHLNNSSECLNCNKIHECPVVSQNNAYCYRAQCMQTSRAIAQELQLTKKQYLTTFQSRLGTTPWIKPYTDKVLADLVHQGVRKIAVVCPSFVADCLETLEEIEIRAREQWMSLGGTHFNFIASLNDHPLWVKALKDIIIK